MARRSPQAQPMTTEQAAMIIAHSAKLAAMTTRCGLTDMPRASVIGALLAIALVVP
jgi:hypothetical protein